MEQLAHRLHGIRLRPHVAKGEVVRLVGVESVVQVVDHPVAGVRFVYYRRRVCGMGIVGRSGVGVNVV